MYFSLSTPPGVFVWEEFLWMITILAILEGVGKTII
jgi:hypothetical protein